MPACLGRDLKFVCFTGVAGRGCARVCKGVRENEADGQTDRQRLVAKTSERDMSSPFSPLHFPVQVLPRDGTVKRRRCYLNFIYI